jgi:hypothetical protein
MGFELFQRNKFVCRHGQRRIVHIVHDPGDTGMFCDISQYPASRMGIVIYDYSCHDHLYFEYGTKVQKFLIQIIMFYVRINKIKVFNNREGFLGLFNRAELRISPATAESKSKFPTLCKRPKTVPANMHGCFGLKLNKKKFQM